MLIIFETFTFKTRKGIQEHDTSKSYTNHIDTYLNISSNLVFTSYRHDQRSKQINWESKLLFLTNNKP